jgi:ribokinase
VVRASHIPRPGETILGGDLHVVPGGKGANQAVAAARLGARVAMIGRVGSDSFAAILLDSLDAAGVDHTFVREDPQAASGAAMIVVEDSGQNSIVVAPGANMQLSPADIDAAEEAIAAAGVLLLQLEVPLQTVLHAVALGRAHGSRIVLNPAPAQPLPADLWPLLDVLVPNETEAALLTGIPVAGPADAAAAARMLQSWGARTVLLTLGENGALLAGAAGLKHFPAFEVTPVDTTAAGDAFVGALATALAEGRPLAEAIRWGNAAGALATTQLGAQTSLPTRPAVEALLERGRSRPTSVHFH